MPDGVVLVFEWIPTALLRLVGTLDLRLLLQVHQNFQPTGWKLRLIPARLRDHHSPWAVVAIGVLFATVFDTATQVSACGFVASNKGGGLLAALAAGLVFTAGMVITDMLDGRLICRISRSSEGAAAGRRYHRALGWIIVAISYGVAAYNIGKALLPGLELDDLAFSLTGAALIALMALVWPWLAYGGVTHRLRSRRRESLRPAGPADRSGSS